jgi:hypothetical protein
LEERGMKKEKEYALYKGDTFVDLGTRKYLAELLGVTEKTIYFYTTPTYKKRGRENDNRYVVIKIEDD